MAEDCSTKTVVEIVKYKFFSVKFIITLIIILISSAFVIFGIMGMDQWLSLMKWVITIFVTGNVATKFTQGKNGSSSN